LFDRSRAHFFVRTANADEALAAVNKIHRKWDFRRQAEVPPRLVGAASDRLRQLYYKVSGGWTAFAIDDLENVFDTAYRAAKLLPHAAVLASRAYKFGDWHLKLYRDKDCILKVGDDADHELAWLPTPLTKERIDELMQMTQAGPAFQDFLEDALEGRPNPSDLELGLGLPRLSVGFAELAAGANEGWTQTIWVKE